MRRHYADADPGRRRIVAMELWDLESIDLLEPGFIELLDDDRGSFRCIAVEGWADVEMGLDRRIDQTRARRRGNGRSRSAAS